MARAPELSPAAELMKKEEEEDLDWFQESLATRCARVIRLFVEGRAINIPDCV